MIKKILLSLLVISSVLSSSANAQSMHPALTDTWQFSLSAFNQRNSAVIRATAPSDIPIDVDLQDLGLEHSKNIPQFGLRRRFASKWAFGMYYSDFSISTAKSISKSFNYDGVTYPINASLNTDLGLGLFVASMDYAFHQSDTTEWGIGLGLHALDLSVDIDATINNIDLGSASESLLAPLPNLRLYTRHAFTPKLLASFNIGWFSATVNQFDGTLLVGAAALDYRVSKRWSLGVNYQITDVDLKIDRGPTKVSSQINLVLDGLALTVRYSIP